MKKFLRGVIPFLKRVATLAMLFTTFHAAAQAQDCGCDFVINPPESRTTTLFINGEELGVQPGQTICLTAGFYMQIRLVKIFGEPGNPVTIKNCGGLVQIGDDTNYGRWYATDIVNCSYIRYTGTGDPAFFYGIKLGRSGDSGLKIGVFSTDTEIDHIEIANPNFAGILCKTDFGGNPPPNAPEMNNVNIHDNYIHDTRGEGMYIGETKSPGQNFRHLEVWNNIVTRTGLELIQVANVVEDIEIHHNVFYRSGLRNVLHQNKGFQIGDNAVGRYYNNFIIGSPSNSMIVMGSGNIEITNNYLEGSGDPSFFIDNRAFVIPGTPVNIHKNFVMDVNETFPFFNVFNEINPINISENKLEGNNAIIGYGSGAGANVSVSGNTMEVIERVQFSDPENGDFTLVGSSPYLDLGLMNDVSGRNQRPYIALIGDHQLDFETTAEVSVSAADADGDAVTLEAFNLPPFVSFNDNGDGSGVFALAPQAADAGIYYKVRVRVTDSKGAMNSQNFNITVLDPYAFLATASSSLLNTDPKNTLDEDMATRWAAGEGNGNWIQYDLREDKLVTSLQIAFFDGTTAVYPFNVEVSEDGNQWVQVFSGESSGTTTDPEPFAFDEIRARHLRILDNGIQLNSYTEVLINCTTAPQFHAFSASDDLYQDGKKIIDDQMLKVKEPKVTSFLRFDVDGLDVSKAAVTRATLKLTAVQPGYGSLKIYLGSEGTWSENGAVKSDLPKPVQVLDTLTGDFATGQIYELNVGAALRDNGTFNLILVAENSRGGLTFSSAEGEFQPELWIETLRGAEVVFPEEPAINTDVPDKKGPRKRNELKLYPNPIVSDNLTVDLGSPETTSVSVEIFDRVGSPVYRSCWTDASQFVEVDLSGADMDPGMYFLKVKADDQPLQTLRLFKR